MNPTSKKFISLFLVFSLVMLSTSLYAKERRGAELEIWGENGKFIKGELIAVKRNSLLLLESGIDVTVDIKDVKVIKIIKKSLAGVGFLVGGCVGAIIGLASYYAKPEPTGSIIIDPGPGLNTIGCGIVGGLIGLVIGGAAGIDKKIQIEGMTDLEIQKTLDKLRKKARIRDYK